MRTTPEKGLVRARLILERLKITFKFCAANTTIHGRDGIDMGNNEFFELEPNSFVF